MTHLSRLAFPELRHVFTGYLHEDYAADGGTPEAALRAFWADADADERRRFQREARRFVAHTATFNLDDLRELLRTLGCRWIPPSREALVSLLTGIAGQ